MGRPCCETFDNFIVGDIKKIFLYFSMVKVMVMIIIMIRSITCK